MAAAPNFDWDDANTEHIVRHGVTPVEVEQAFTNHPLVVLAAQKRGGEERLLCAGLTDAGRALQFVYTMRHGGGPCHYSAHGEEEGEGETMKTKRVKPIVVDTPVFRSEAEEAKWWDRHQDLIADLLLKHGRRGAVPTKSISVRLPVTDIERARKLAEKRGVGYQSVIKTLLHEALRKESKIA